MYVQTERVAGHVWGKRYKGRHRLGLYAPPRSAHGRGQVIQAG